MTAEPFALATVAGLLLVKEAGLPIPVPGDLVVIGAGVAAGHGTLDPPIALVALVVASIAGDAIQFALLTTAARAMLLRGLARLGLPVERLERQAVRLRTAGARGIAVARMTPGVRIVTIAAPVVAGVPARAFVAGLVAGNSAFIAVHFGLGFVLGEPVVTLVGSLLGPLAAGGAILAIVGALGWAMLARRRPARGDAPGLPVVAWTDAACPACLLLATFEATRG